MAGNSTEAGRSVTNKITSILMTFTEGSEHTLTEIAQLAGLPISTAHRLTSELASWRLLERTPDGRYRAGLPLRMMGSGDAVPARLCASARRASSRTSPASPAAASRLGVLQELEVAYIEKQPGPRPVSSFMPAATLPVHPTALGRALLAFAPASIVEMTILRGLRAVHPAHRDGAGPLPPRARGRPADPGRGHPLRARGRPRAGSRCRSSARAARSWPRSS